MNAPVMNKHVSVSRRQALQGMGALVVMIPSSSFAAEATGAAAKAAAEGNAVASVALDPAQLDSWLALAADGKVTAYFGKVDMGQGANVAIAQMVADELDVPLDSVFIKMDDMSVTINQGDVSGNSAISNAGMVFRVAAAEARKVLLEQAAAKFNVPVERLTVANGVITVSGDAGKKVTYAELVGGKKFNTPVEWNKQYGNPLAITGKAKLKTPEQFKVIGTSADRRDIPGKIFATMPYITDIKVPGMLHARMIRPPFAGQTIVAVDEASIKDIPGARVARKGEVLAVVAPKEWDALRAQTALKVTWSEPKDVFPTSAELYNYIRTAPATKTTVEVKPKGDLAAAFTGAAKVVEAEYEWPFQSHASMGPACAIADTKPDRVTLWTGTMKPHFARAGLAKLLGFKEDQVQVNWIEGPGSYGRNDAGDAGADAVIVSQIVGAPVRVQYTRAEATAWDPKGPPSVHKVKAGLDANGKIVAWQFSSRAIPRLDVAQREGEPGDTLAGQALGVKPTPGPVFGIPTHLYVFGDSEVSWETVAPLMPMNSPLRTSHLRDPLGPQLHFAVESFIDEAAEAAKADPVEFRLKHMTDERHIAAIKTAAEKSGWKAGPAGTRRGKNGDLLTGQGIGYAENSGGCAAVVADVEVNPSTGRVWVKKLTVAHDCGLIINPKTLTSVVEGNVMQGVSRAIYEEVTFDKRKVTSDDWVTYPILEIQDAPETLDVILLNRPNDPSCGAGEVAIRMVAGAINNAVYEATGRRIRRGPLTPARVKAAIA